jgi:putative flippase GtrA
MVILITNGYLLIFSSFVALFRTISSSIMLQVISDILTLDFSRQTTKQVMRFVIAGVTCAALEFTTLIGLVEWVGLDMYLANTIAFTAAVVLNYVMSRGWVFESNKYSKKRYEFTAFALMAVVGLGLNQLIMWGCVDVLSLDYKLSKVLAIGLVVIWNFFSKKYLVFKS